MDNLGDLSVQKNNLKDVKLMGQTRGLLDKLNNFKLNLALWALKVLLTAILSPLLRLITDFDISKLPKLNITCSFLNIFCHFDNS